MARKKQEELPAMEGPGIAPVKIRAIDKLADEYIEARDQRMQMTPLEVAAKTKLIDALRANVDKIGTDPEGTIIYRYDTIVITLEPGKAKLKVKDESDIADTVDDSGNE
jgi:hypothetical protein